MDQIGYDYEFMNENKIQMNGKTLFIYGVTLINILSFTYSKKLVDHLLSRGIVCLGIFLDFRTFLMLELAVTLTATLDL